MNLEMAHRNRAETLPLEQFDVSDPALYRDDVWRPYFERLRLEDPIHYCRESRFGPFWSVTKYNDIMAVELDHGKFSSESSLGGITILDRPMEFRRQHFLSMDPPRHDEQRKAVQPIVAPANLARLERSIEERTCEVLDGLPRDQEFNWVERVSIELTCRMLATLFDVPFEDRRKLTYWSDVATIDLNSGGVIDTEEKRGRELAGMVAYFKHLWNERASAPARPDLISMLAHNPSTQNLSDQEFEGILTLLIVGGNDTTRNSMSGGLWFLHQNPHEFRKLQSNPNLIETMVPEIIRYQTPLAHMRRTATADVQIGGKKIREGDKVVMWYISGNRDGSAVERADDFIIDRARPRQHLSFGFGIHRCVGNRLAELQLKILWREILKRFGRIEVMEPPRRVYSSFVHGISELKVRIPA